MSLYYFGKIVIAHMDDGFGRSKDRTALIIDSDSNCSDGGEILVMAISSRHEIPVPNHHILVHDRNGRDSVTGLTRPCWAKCNWVRLVAMNRITGRLGDMPDDLLVRIYDKYCELDDDQAFSEWQ